MALYYVRTDSMTQATTTFAPVETAADGSTAGPIAIPPGVKRIKSITATWAINGQATTNTGAIFVVRISGTGALPDGTQELIVGSIHTNDGAGTLGYTYHDIVTPNVIPVDIKVNGGADLSLLAAYFGTDPGSPGIQIGVEFE